MVAVFCFQSGKSRNIFARPAVKLGVYPVDTTVMDITHGTGRSFGTVPSM
jgi:hypothetical protein